MILAQLCGSDINSYQFSEIGQQMIKYEKMFFIA